MNATASFQLSEGQLLAVFKVPAGVNVVNADGTTTTVTPGRKFIRFNLASGELNPAGTFKVCAKFKFTSVSAWLQFRKMGFSVNLLGGAGPA